VEDPCQHFNAWRHQAAQEHRPARFSWAARSTEGTAGYQEGRGKRLNACAGVQLVEVSRTKRLAPTSNQMLARPGEAQRK